MRQHPDYIAGIKTRDEILSEFLSNFERSPNPDGVITPDEFVKYYNQIRYARVWGIRCLGVGDGYCFQGRQG